MRLRGTPVLIYSTDRRLLGRLVDSAQVHSELSPSWCDTIEEARLKLSLRPKALLIDLNDLEAWRLADRQLMQRRVVILCDDARCVARIAQYLLKGVAGVFSRDDPPEVVTGALFTNPPCGIVGPSWQKWLSDFERLAMQNAGLWRFFATLRKAAFAGLCLETAGVSARQASDFGLTRDTYYYAKRALEDAFLSQPTLEPSHAVEIARRLGFLSLLTAAPNEQPDPDIDALVRLWHLKRLGR